MTRRTLITLFLLLGLITGDSVLRAESPGTKVLVHVVTNIKKDDGPPCVAFDIAYANVLAGNQVEILFDSEAAWNLKKTDADGKSDFDRYDVPLDLRQLVASQLGDKDLLQVKTFGAFLELLARKGAVITVNGTWNVLTSVERDLKGKTKMPSVVTPLTLKEMVEHMNSAEKYYRY
jgi:hypothetical protein